MADITLDKSISFEDLKTAFKAENGTPSEPTKDPVTEPVTDPVTEPATTEDAKPADEGKEGEKKAPRRFSEMTRQIRDAEAKALEAQQRADTLAKELADAKAGKQPEAPKADEGKPKPPNATNWDGTWQELEAAREKYAEDLADWKAEKKIAEATAKKAADDARSQAEERLKDWRKQEDKILDTHGETAQKALKTVGDVVAKLGILDVIRESEVGGDIVMALHADPEALAKLAKLSPYSAAREIGRMEDRIIAKQPATATAKTPLPKPPSVVGGGTGAGSAPVDANKLGYGELRSLVNNEVKRRK